MTQVALHTDEALLPLGFRVYMDWYTKVFDFQGTWDSGDIGGLVLCQDLRLGLVQLKVPRGGETASSRYTLKSMGERTPPWTTPRSAEKECLPIRT